MEYKAKAPGTEAYHHFKKFNQLVYSTTETSINVSGYSSRLLLQHLLLVGNNISMLEVLHG